MQPVLAQYSIRSKQDYIFKTNKIVEIVGASSHIRDAWKYLFECADSIGLKVKTASESAYEHETILADFESGKSQVVELFCGGGNETFLIDSIETFYELNRVFSLYLLKNCSGMTPMAVCVPVTGNYSEDYRSLMAESEIEKNRMMSGQDSFILPFSLMDRETFRPMTKLDSMDGELIRYSDESYSKRIKGLEERNKDKATKLLDEMVTKKGEESLLAVVHADGNNMGSKIMTMLSGKSSYTECVNLMREFTLDTAKAFGESGLRALEDKQKELSEKVEKQDVIAYRVIIKDGDDMTFICNARYVMEYVKAYVQAVCLYESKWNYSSCAGICIFHSHYPFAKAYQLAEQACDDGAKRMVHKTNDKGEPLAIEEGWVDYHYIHSGIGGDLGEIRRSYNTADCMARPWLISGENSTNYKIESLYKLSDLVKTKKIARVSIKNIGATAEESIETGIRELRRVYNHYDELENDVKKLFGDDEEMQLKAFYDFSEVYDLWFGEDK